MNPNSSSKTKFHNFAFSMSLYRISFNLIIKLTLAYSSSNGPAFPKRKFWSLFETLFKMVSQITNHLRGLEWFHDVSQKLRKQRRKIEMFCCFILYIYILFFLLCMFIVLSWGELRLWFVVYVEKGLLMSLWNCDSVVHKRIILSCCVREWSYSVFWRWGNGN